jgi:hypothetical protein
MVVIVDECRGPGCEHDVDMTREEDGDMWGYGPQDPQFCSDDCRDNASEAAYERSMEDYYGGSGPATISEQLAAARALKDGRP